MCAFSSTLSALREQFTFGIAGESCFALSSAYKISFQPHFNEKPTGAFRAGNMLGGNQKKVFFLAYSLLALMKTAKFYGDGNQQQLTFTPNVKNVSSFVAWSFL